MAKKSFLCWIYIVIIITFLNLYFVHTILAQDVSGIISNVRVSSFSSSEIIVEWDTNISEKSTLYWTANPSCSASWNMINSGDRLPESVSKTSHRLYLGATNYEKICFQIQDSSGNITQVNEFSKPNIENLIISNINYSPSANSVKINWTTNFPASSAAFIKESGSAQYFYNSDKKANNNTFTTSHELIINNLNSKTSYEVRLESITDYNRLATNLFSGTSYFTTNDQNVTTINTEKPDLIITGVDYTVGNTLSGSQKLISFNVKYKNNSAVDIYKNFYFYVEALADANYPNDFKSSASLGYPSNSTIPAITANTESSFNSWLSYLMPIDASLNRTFKFCIDQDKSGLNTNLVEESNENNNCFIKSVVIQAAKLEATTDNSNTVNNSNLQNSQTVISSNNQPVASQSSSASNNKINQQEQVINQQKINAPLATKKTEQNVIFESGRNLNIIISHTGKIKDTKTQSDAMKKYTDPITKRDKKITINQKYAINNFIVYGTQSTKNLTPSKRYQAVNKFMANFKKLPKSESDWAVVLKITKP